MEKSWKFKSTWQNSKTFDNSDPPVFVIKSNFTPEETFCTPIWKVLSGLGTD